MKKIIVIAGIVVIIFLAIGTKMMLNEKSKWTKGVFFRPETSYIGFTDKENASCEFELYVVENYNIDFIDSKNSDCYITGNKEQSLKASSFQLSEQEVQKHYKIYRIKLYFNFKKQDEILIKRIGFLDKKTGENKSFSIGNLVLEYKSTEENKEDSEHIDEEEIVWGYTNILVDRNEYRFSIENKTKKAIKISNVYLQNEKFADVKLDTEFAVLIGKKVEFRIKFKNKAEENDVIRIRPIIEYSFEGNPKKVFYKTMAVAAIYENTIPSEVLNDYLSKK